MSERGDNALSAKPGTLDEALANGRLMLRERPDLALAQAHAILRRDPRSAPALRLAAAAHRAQGENDQAAAAELAAIKHSQSVPALVEAARALDRSDPAEASRIVAQHLRTTPHDLAALTLSAEAAIGLGLPDKAEQLLRDVVDRAPGFARAETLLISALMRQDKLIESRSRVQAIIGAQPGDGAALRLLARIQTDLGNHDEAALTYEQLIKSEDKAAELWLLYGDALRFLGRNVDSRIAYQRALALVPGFGQAWWGLVNLNPRQVQDEDLVAMTNALADSADRPNDAGNLNFALGTALDAQGRYQEAFRYFEAGNALSRAAQPYDPEEISAQVDRYIAAFPEGSVPPMLNKHATVTPIFVVGMPRSGSTLVERILGRHSTIEPLGELPVVPHIVEWLKLQQPEDGLERQIARLGMADLDKLAERYRDRAGERRKTRCPYFTDKLHMNWRHLALILRLFPGARVIDVRRSALDCCWSNYKLLFARGHPASADLNDLGRFYADYVRFLDHFNAIAPGRILRLSYEALVDDIEGETRRMLDYIGLPFEADCLDFHQSTQSVATASSEQVRQPLNRDGIGAWRPYREWLGPLRVALGTLAEE